MVHGGILLLILTVLRQANSSIFDQFDSPGTSNKNKMLMYFRGLLTQNGTTFRPTKRTTTLAPGSLTLEQFWDKKGLPDKHDKSNMLAYLRGMKAPNSISGVQEPERRGLHVYDNVENKQTDGLNPVIRLSEFSKDLDHQVSWDHPGLDTPTVPPAKDSESDTCFWRNQQSQQHQHKLVDDLVGGRRQATPPTTIDTTNAPDKDKVIYIPGVTVIGAITSGIASASRK